MKKIFLKDNPFGEFAYQVDIDVKLVDDEGKEVSRETYKYFLRVWDVDTLQNLMNTAIERENYECAQLIKEVLDEKLIKNQKP